MTEKSSNPSYVSIKDEKTYNQLIESKDLTVIHFYTPWSQQCSQMCDAVEEMLKLDDFKQVKFAKIHAEDFPKISLKDGVSAVPTIVFYKNGKIIDRVDGVNPVALVEKTRKQLSLDSPGPMEENAELLETRLKKLTNQAPCMLFMKGNPTNPRCGFSRTIISLLDSYKADYQTFDILEDNAVREGLKKLSDWPTYPQLYINGELIGGLDIVKEMSESGVLKEMLPQKATVEERIQKIINKASVVIVIKGTRNNPRCIYTKQLLEILDVIKVKYETFDVLSDEELRAAFKAYSDWSTYPQVYKDGELIGGFETIKDLYDNSEIQKTLENK